MAWLIFITSILLSGRAISDPTRTEACAGCLEKLPVEKTTESELQSKISNLGCELEVGEPRTITSTDETSPTGVEQHYKLTHVEEKKYLVELDMEFFRYGVPTTLFPGASEKDVKEHKRLRFEMWLRVRQCFKEINPYLKGPKGETIELKLTWGKDVPKNKVKIKGEGFNTNRSEYSAAVDCAGIAHEVMHNLGLADEYKETAYDCRSVGPIDSIMYKHSVALASVKDSYDVETRSCRCQKTTDECKSTKITKSDIAKASCKEGYEMITSLRQDIDKQSTDEKQDLEKRNFESPIHTVSGIYYSLFPSKITKVPPKRDSLLYPAQFRAITHPNCYSKNKTIYECYQNAYRTTKGKRSGEGCLPIPKECEDPNIWLKK